MSYFVSLYPQRAGIFMNRVGLAAIRCSSEGS